MKNIIILASLTIGFSLFLAACGDVNVNTNRMANQAGNAVNRTANMAGNAVNAIANTATAMTTPSADDFLKAAAQTHLA